MVVRKGYKQTEIGEIPEDWTLKKIHEFTDVTSGGTPKTVVQEYWDGEIKWMNSGELNLKKIFDVSGRITELGVKNSSTKIIPKNCVLVGLAGQGKTRGTVAINYVELCINQSICAIYPNQSFDPEYLYFILDSRYKELRELSYGGEGRGSLNLSLIRNILVPFPPSTDEQSRIKQTLLNFDKIIESHEKFIDKKKNIKQGTMQELLTGKRRLGRFSGEWGIKKLGKISQMSSGGTPLTTEKSFYGGNIPWAIITDITKSGKYINSTEKTITERGLENSSAKKFNVGTLLFAMYASLGKCCITKIELACNQAILGIETISIDTEFLYYYLSFYEKTFSQKSQRGTQQNLNKKIVQDLDILYPFCKEEQRAIVEILSNMDCEIEALEKQRDKYIQLKQGMMQKLLTGQIRLV